MIGDPFPEGGVQVTAIEWRPRTQAFIFDGAPGGPEMPSGVTVTGRDGKELPAALVAVAVMV